MIGSFLDEIVDDSEPEREEWRREIRELSHKSVTTREVIELTDDESDVNLLHRSRVIDISGSTASESVCSRSLTYICQITPPTPSQALRRLYQALCLLQRTVQKVH